MRFILGIVGFEVVLACLLFGLAGRMDLDLETFARLGQGRSLIDLVFPDDDEAFRLHMDFYVVVMAQMVSGSLLINEPLYAYRLHGKNFAANRSITLHVRAPPPRRQPSRRATQIDYITRARPPLQRRLPLGRAAQIDYITRARTPPGTAASRCNRP